MNFDSLKKSNRFYGGSEQKISLTDGSNYYMAKFRKNSVRGYTFNHVSEYLGSHIFKLIGLDTHDTYLGHYCGADIVLCKDFISDGSQFVAFNDVGESSIEEDKTKFQYTYEDIVKMLKENKKITNVQETIDRFFDIFIVDALIANPDRHGGNWGFLKRDNKYTLAPVFDNGASLFPGFSEENEDELEYILNNEDEINERVFQFPWSHILLNKRLSSYYQVINSLMFEECNNALKRIVPKINLSNINELIDSVECISDIRKRFLKTLIKTRYEKILMESYEKLLEKERQNGK